MDSFLPAVRWILKAEGVNGDPQDQGGPTKYGISQRAHPDIDLATLTEQHAIEIYRNQYWLAYHIDKLPRGIAIAVLDGAVQHGGKPAIKMLQHCLKVEMDGIIGMETLAAAYKADLSDLLMNYLARRASYYATLSQVGRYGYGWYRRLFNLCAYCKASERN